LGTENHGSKGKEPLGFLIIIPLIPIDSRVALVKAIRLFAFSGLEFAQQPFGHCRRRCRKIATLIDAMVIIILTPQKELAP